jgi:hypothetical protein
MQFILPFENFQIYIQNALVIKVVNSVLFHLEWLKHSVSIQKKDKIHLILNLGPFLIFWLNSVWNVLVSFHMFHSAFKKSLNQIEPYSI